MAALVGFIQSAGPSHFFKNPIFNTMPRAKLDWCVVHLGEDLNWWVDETSDDVHWDVDALGIIDPRQLVHVLDLLEPLREYGYEPESSENAFFIFRIEKEIKGTNKVRLARVHESLYETEEQVFALADMTDEEKGAYADFLDQISRARVKMLNDLIEFDQSLTVDELEEAIRERQNADYFEGRSVHPFNEITAILEYVPDGYELDVDEERTPAGEGEGLEDIPDFEEEGEAIEEDETMRWDEDEVSDSDEAGTESEHDEDEDEDSDDEDEDEDEDEEEEESEDEDEDHPRRRH